MDTRPTDRPAEGPHTVRFRREGAGSWHAVEPVRVFFSKKSPGTMGELGSILNDQCFITLGKEHQERRPLERIREMNPDLNIIFEQTDTERRVLEIKNVIRDASDRRMGKI